MYIDEAESRKLLRKLVHAITTDSALIEDLMQEALIHLWQREVERPGQTQSWYIQSCRFHVLNHLSRGRSVDSMKHRYARSTTTDVLDSMEVPDNRCGSDESPFASISARDILVSLSKHAKPSEQVVLDFLADGFGVQEIAHEMNVSHQAVSKLRRRIANLAIQIGISPLPKRIGSR